MAKAKRPPVAAIVEANSALIAKLDLRGGNPARTCWACGLQDGPIYRAHVVAHARGGSADPSNFFLLCATCHDDQPDLESPDVQLAWLVSHESEVTRSHRRALAQIDGRRMLEATR